MALSETAREAVALSAKLSNEQNSPVPGPDGRVVYTFGVGQPTLVATPLRVSSIELQAGEKILGEPQIGDSVRWVVTPILSGSGDAATPILVVKPKMTGLDTTMIVATDRRTYYLRLVSKPGEYVSRVAFLYPDDQPLQWKLFLEQQAKEHKDHVDASRISQTGNRAVDKLYFDYTFKVKSGADSIRPVRVLDDGEKTYIEMPSVTAFQELPTLVIEGPEGNEMVNFRVKGTTFVVDRLFVKAAVLLGVGKHQELVEIERKDALTPHTEGEVMADENKVDGNLREEVVLSPKVEGDSPTRSKQPLKLRFWPTDGKHLNPAVRGMLFVVVLGFLVVMVYGVMSRGGKKKAADAANDEQSISDAQSTGTKVWKDLEDQRKIDARKEALDQAQAGGSAPDALQDRVQSAGVPAELVASSQDSKVSLVPPLEARQISASGRPAQATPTNGRAALNQQQAGPQAAAPAGRSAADEWREEMYKDDLEARTAGTSISSGKGLGALGSLGASLPPGGVGSVLQQLLGEYPKAGSGGNAGGPSPSLIPQMRVLAIRAMRISRNTKRTSSTRQDRPGTSGIIRPRRERQPYRSMKSSRDGTFRRRSKAM